MEDEMIVRTLREISGTLNELNSRTLSIHFLGTLVPDTIDGGGALEVDQLHALGAAIAAFGRECSDLAEHAGTQMHSVLREIDPKARAALGLAPAKKAA